MRASGNHEEKGCERMLNPGDRFGDCMVERRLGQGGRAKPKERRQGPVTDLRKRK